jgi:aminopeptidase
MSQANTAAEASEHQHDAAFEARVQQGALNAVKCMGVAASDRVLILTDYERGAIARRVAAAALDRHAAVSVHFLEHYGQRPLTAFPEGLRNDLRQFQPTVTFYIATTQPGEIGFRIPLLPFLTRELRARHGHMPGVDERLMAEGMCADYDQVYEITNRVYEIVRQAQRIHVTSRKGSDITATFNPRWKWIPCHGRYHEPGQWGNLPEGEVFTAPADVNGVLVCDVLGDYFSARYGVLARPVRITIKDGYATEVSSEDEAVAKDLRDYLFSVPNGNRVGEFAIGTLISLKQPIGNLLQDEKIPGLHVAFGNPYPEYTGADWDARIHVDVVPTTCTIEVDGRLIMRDGEFCL